MLHTTVLTEGVRTVNYQHTEIHNSYVRILQCARFCDKLFEFVMQSLFQDLTLMIYGIDCNNFLDSLLVHPK